MDMNIRNIDPKLVEQLKVLAIKSGVTLKAYCIEVLAYNVLSQEPLRGPSMALMAESAVKSAKDNGKVNAKGKLELGRGQGPTYVRVDTPKAAKAALPAANGVMGQKCPHGWMNAYVCQDGCNG